MKGYSKEQEELVAFGRHLGDIQASIRFFPKIPSTEPMRLIRIYFALGGYEQTYRGLVEEATERGYAEIPAVKESLEYICKRLGELMPIYKAPVTQGRSK
jgi:hypothetical protein